jgi:hypothetical protein
MLWGLHKIAVNMEVNRQLEPLKSQYGKEYSKVGKD